MSDVKQAPTTAPEEESAFAERQSLLSDLYGKKVDTPQEPDAGETLEQPEEAEAPETDEAQPETPEEEAATDDETEPEGAPSEDTDETSDTSDDEFDAEAVTIADYDFGKDWKEIPVETNVHGERKHVPLGNLVESYQKGEAADQRLEEAKAKDSEASQLKQELESQKQQIEAQYATGATLIQHAEQMLENDFRNVNWEDLRSKNPAEYSAKKQDWQERKQQIEGLKQYAQQQLQATQQQTQQQAQEQYKQHLAKEQEAMLQKIPDWKDESRFKAEKQELTSYLKGTGFSEQDILGASDHRLILLARKAMLYDRGKEKVDTAKKKVKKAPKVLKQGAANQKETAKPPETGILDDLYPSARRSK